MNNLYIKALESKIEDLKKEITRLDKLNLNFQNMIEKLKHDNDIYRSVVSILIKKD